MSSRTHASISKPTIIATENTKRAISIYIFYALVCLLVYDGYYLFFPPFLILVMFCVCARSQVFFFKGENLISDYVGVKSSSVVKERALGDIPLVATHVFFFGVNR